MPKRDGEKMALISVHLSPKMLQQIEELVRRDLSSSQREAIRSAIRELLLNHGADRERREKPRKEPE
ncbi:MAG: ribbon-helix-helix domain-containing protein [Pyrobaculum sp.]|uniref:ribbon-helix-helix domain-containing protein n=1 Tax=Pyrobaculum sp. TaxID=2004705 RepID=UPI00317A22CE